MLVDVRCKMVDGKCPPVVGQPMAEKLADGKCF